MNNKNIENYTNEDDIKEILNLINNDMDDEDDGDIVDIIRQTRENNNEHNGCTFGYEGKQIKIKDRTPTKTPHKKEDFIMDGNLLPVLCKYEKVHIANIYAYGEYDTIDEESPQEAIIGAVREKTSKNRFLDISETDEWAFKLLVKFIENIDINILLHDVREAYDVYDKSILRDMFIVMSVVLNPTTFVMIICALYIEHIAIYQKGTEFYEDLSTYYEYVVFNNFFRKESIEKMFLEILHYNSPYIYISSRIQELSYNMFQSMITLNSYPELVDAAEELYTCEEIFDVDEYITNAIYHRKI